MDELTQHDLQHLHEVYTTEVLPFVEDETYDGPAIAMTSIGYVEVFADGDVVAYGQTIGNVEEAP